MLRFGALTVLSAAIAAFGLLADSGPDGDVDFFVLPGVRADRPAPLVIAGDGAVQFDRREDVNRLMTYLATPDGARAWAGSGGYISARTTVDPAPTTRASTSASRRCCARGAPCGSTAPT